MVDTAAGPSGPGYGRLLRNRAFLFLWTGQTVSTAGDAFFNLAVVWVVYTESGSALQTALIQAIWHVDRIVFGPLAGALADRWDRKRILLWSNALSAAVVAAVAGALFARGGLPPAAIFAAVFVLNTLNTFVSPARASLMPTLVGRDLMATAAGWFSTAGQVASFVGSALAGVVVAAAGAAWSVLVDAASFVVAAVAIAAAPLPARGTARPPAGPRPSIFQEIVEGWRATAHEPVVRALIWLSLLINVPSFLGPLYPALVRVQLGGDAAAYGLLSAAAVAGGAAGGALAGALERRLGAGRLLVVGWAVAGLSVVAMAISTTLALTAALAGLQVFGLVAGGVSIGALTAVLVPGEYRGRVAGITGALAVLAIPPSSLLGGWLADLLGPAPLFVVGGAWTLGVAAVAWLNPHVRAARL